MNLKTPYSDGRTAAKAGKGRSDNPYAAYSGRTGMKRRAWNRGFTSAMKEKQKQLEKQES